MIFLLEVVHVEVAGRTLSVVGTIGTESRWRIHRSLEGHERLYLCKALEEKGGGGSIKRVVDAAATPGNRLHRAKDAGPKDS
jgi:hypothetical protein